MRNCPLLKKILGPMLASLNIFRDSLLVTQKFETPPPHPSAFRVFVHLQCYILASYFFTFFF